MSVEMDLENSQKFLMDKLEAQEQRIQTEAAEQVLENETLEKQNVNDLPEIPELPQETEQAGNYSLRTWWVILSAHSLSPFQEKAKFYEEAVKYIPACYKIWYNYLKDAIASVQCLCVLSNQYAEINKLFERAILYLSKVRFMPCIWIMYCEFLISQKRITQTRQVFDRALISLPLNQHDKIWNIYLDWALSLNIIKTAKNIIKRYLKINSNFKEQFIEYLIQKEEYNEAAIYYKQILDDTSYYSESGKSSYQFLVELCDLISKHPDSIVDIDCESIIKHGIRKYTDEVGNLWICLANYYIRKGLFNKARDVFEEALENIQTARDFGIIFNAYVRFEEEMINLISEDTEENLLEKQKDEILENEINKILGLSLEEKMIEEKDELNYTSSEIDYRIKRLEKLLERRPLLLNNCLLRQNPNNVAE